MQIFCFSDTNLQKKSNYQGNNKLIKVNKLIDINKKDFNFGLLYFPTKDIAKNVHELETISDIPYIIVTDVEDINKDKFYGISQVDIIHISEIEKIDPIISKYFIEKNKKRGLSVFELTDIMQIVAMERKNVAIKIIKDTAIGVIVFKDGKPIYSKLNENKQTFKGIKAAYKILSWDKPIFKLAHITKSITSNLDTSLMNLLMGAMQYKDELLGNDSSKRLEQELRKKKRAEKKKLREKKKLEKKLKEQEIKETEKRIDEIINSKEKDEKKIDVIITSKEEKNLEDEKSFNLNDNSFFNDDKELKEKIINSEKKEEIINIPKLKIKVKEVFKKFNGLLEVSIFKKDSLIFSENKNLDELLKNSTILLNSVKNLIEKIELGYLEKIILTAQNNTLIFEYNFEKEILIILLIKNDANLSIAKILSTNLKQMVALNLP